MSFKRSRSSIARKDGSGKSFRFAPNRITAAVLVSMGVAPAWGAEGVGTNVITLHGAEGSRTNTTFDTVDRVTSISTGTVRGSTAFNSFGDFKVTTGNTVNLNVPTGARNLVNLVHDSQAVINGTLNGLQDGKIGGNVIFADPHGLVVGAQGVVNVGSLTITTPSATDMLKLHTEAVSGTATASDKLADDLRKGSYNNSTDGKIEIDGQINTNGAINLFGAAAVVNTGARLNAGTEAAQAVFQSTVNTQGLMIGAGVTRSDGSIQIVAADKVEISGELAALMADTRGGSVSVDAASSIALNNGARITTKGAAGKDSGTVNLSAPAIALAGRATIDSSASGAGKAGDIRLTAYSDLSNSGSAATSVNDLKSQLEKQSDGLLAGKLGKASINLGAGTTLNAGQADGSKRGDVTVTAFAFDRQLSGYADASATIEAAGSITGKNISLQASSESKIGGSLLSSLLANNASLKADFDRIKAAGDGVTGYTDEETWAAILTTLGDAGRTSFDKLGKSPTNWSELVALIPNIAVAIANADAKVSVASTAVLNASSDLTLLAEGNRTVDTATGTIPGLAGKLPFNLGVSYGRISGTTEVGVASGAQLTVGHDLKATATSDDTLHLEASATNSHAGNGSQASTAGFAFGMAQSDVSTSAHIDDGASLSVVNDVILTALTQQSLKNDVSFSSIGEGAVGGPAVALTLFNSSTRAVFDADLQNANNLSVSAINLVDEQSNSASVKAGKTTGDFLTARATGTFAPLSSYLVGTLKQKLGFKVSPDTTEPTESKFRFASAAAIGIAEHTAEAIVGSGSSAPSIKLSGDLSVQALQRESDLRNSADSAVNSNAELTHQTGTGDNTGTALSVAVSYNQLTLKTHALVGDGTHVEANRIGVGAKNEQLLDLEGLDRWSSLSEVYDLLKSKVTSLTDLPSQLATSYANAKGEADKLAMTGAVAVTVNSLDATAWVGDGVTLKAKSTSDAAWTSNPLAGLEPVLSNGSETDASKALRALSFSWDAPLAVQARTEVEQLSVVGNLKPTLLGANSAGQSGSGEGTAVGGAVNVQVTNNRTVAGIGANGSVTAQAVNVAAEQDELIIGVSPSAGKGASVAVSGAFVVSTNNAQVSGSIHNSTAVNADKVTVRAEHHVGMWTAAGALAASDESGVGAGVALNVLTSSVEALVADNRSWRPSVLGGGAAGAGNANWKVNALLVDATSDGQAGAFGVAGALAKSADEQKKQDELDKTDGFNSTTSSMPSSLSDAFNQFLLNGLLEIGGGLDAAQTKANSVKESVLSIPTTLKGCLDKIKNAISGKGGDTQQGTQEGSLLAVAGSIGINVSGQKTRAQLGDIVLDPRDPPSTSGKGSNVTVQALNQTHQFAGAGAGALTLAGTNKSESSAAVSGAIAYDHLYNTTEALLQNATLNNNDALKVSALNAGDQIAMGLGLSVATGGESNLAVSVSLSGAAVDNATRAKVTNSTVNQRSSAPGSIAVTAYDRSRLLVGGGAFAGSNGKGTSGTGVATVAVLSNEITADWLGSTAKDFASFDVAAISATRVLAGAISVAASSGEESNAGAASLYAVVLDNTIRASVDQNGTTASSLNGGAVNVDARSATNNAALDALLSDAADATLADADLDMDGSDTASGIDAEVDTNDNLTDAEGDAGTTSSHALYTGDSSGEAVLAIAGSVAGTGGKAGVGGAVGVVYTGSTYQASVAHTALTLTGDLNVNALNNTQVLAAAIGAGGGKDVGVAGSASAVVARGSVEASLDMTGRTLTAANVTVSANKTGGAYSLAGALAASTQSAAVGAAIALSDMQQTVSATLQNGTYRLSGDATVSAAQQSRIITCAIALGVSGEGSAVSGAITYNRIADTTEALLDNADLKARDLAITASQASLGASIWSIAFNLAAGGGQAGVGGALAVNLIDAERSATLSDSTVELTGTASLASSLDGEIWGLGVNAAGGGEAGVGGSIVVNNIDGSDTVSVDHSTLKTTGSGKGLNVDASGGNGLTIGSLSGSITGGGSAAVGGALSVNRIGADRTAQIIGGSTVSGFSTADVKSGADQTIYAIAVAGGGSGTAAVNGSSTTNILSGRETAKIEGGSVTGGALNVTADHGDRTIWSLAGAISGAGTTAVGVANANNVILATREAGISNATLGLTGALTVESGGSAHIRSAAVGAGGAGTAAVGGSVAVNVVDGEESASLSNVTLTGGSGVTVQVTRGDVDIKTLAGNVQGAGTAAVGAAVAVSTVDQQRSASVTNSSLTLSSSNTGIGVNALTQASIQTLAISGAGGGTAGVALSNTSNNINAVTHATVTDSTGSASSLTVSARDGSTIESLAGGVGLGGTAGVGVATAVNRIANDIEAHLSGSKNSTAWALNDVKVSALSDASILTSSISGAASGTAGVAAGVATNLLQTQSRALIDGGARLVAQNNVGVIAYNRDTIQALASAVAASGNAGVSGLVTVNFIESETKAGIGGATTQVTALGKGTGLSVDGGALQNAPDASTWADPEQFNPVADLKTTTETVRGIAVRATSLQQVGQLASSIGVSLVPITSAAVSGLSNTTVLGGSTTAYVDDAILNGSNTGANAAQQVSVGAAAHSYNFGGVVSGALSLGAAAVAATIDTGVISRDVTARISKATVTSLGETTVRATATQVSSDIVTSAAGGIVGVGGSGGVLILKGTTQALVAPGSVLTVGSLKVAASATNRLSPNTGSISGGAVGVGAGLGFGYNQSTVRAWVGQTDTGSGAATTRTTVNTTGAVNITADSSTGILANSISASGGGVAVAGATNVILLENVTEAGARYADFGSSGNRAGSLTIHARDRLNALLNAGSAGVGAVSVGGSANVLVTNNATRAQLLDSTAWLSGALKVEGLREVSASLNTLNGGASANASIGGALGLLLLGSGAVSAQDDSGQSYNASGELDKGGDGTLSLADSFGTRSNADTDYQTSSVDADGNVSVVSASTGDKDGSETTALSDRLDGATQYSSLDSRFNAQAATPAYKQETVARLNNATVNATGAATVTASDTLNASNLAGGAQLSGAASVGAAAAFTFSNAKVFADITGGSLTASSLTLTGSSGALDTSKDAITVRAYNGALGMGAGIGAAVAVAVMSNSVSSSLGGTLSLTGALDASLNDDLHVSADGVGAAAGTVGVGIVVAVADRKSTLTLNVQNSASLTAQRIDLSSEGEGAVSATATGAAGGLLGAGNAVVTVASDRSTVKTTTGNNVTFNAGTGGLALSATALPSVYSKAIGATLGGLVGVGASAATAIGNATVEASLGAGNTLLGGNGLTLNASLSSPAGDDPDDANIRAYSIAGTGGLYFAANGSVAVAKNTSHVTTRTGDNLKLPGGRIEISADSSTHQYADALGVAVGGLAVGASVATASSDSHTDVITGSLTASSGVTVGDVVIEANGSDLNDAKSIAGSGGLVSGNASVAVTTTTGESSVTVGAGSNLTADSFSLNAAYAGRYGAQVDSVNAAVVGGSGAGATNTVNGSSTVTVGSSAALNARRDLLISAHNTFNTHRFADAMVSGAGGGVISGQAVTNRTTITGNALVEIGQSARLIAGSGASDTSGKLMVRAYTVQSTSEDATLSTGGAIAVGGSGNSHTSTLNNTVQVDANASLSSFGELGLGTYTQAAATIEALVSTWGLAGVGVAKADAHLTSNQSVTLGTNASVEALGSIVLGAGQDPEGLWDTRLITNANAQSVVRGLIAIPDAEADSYITNNTSVSVASGAQVLAARNITVGGFNGFSDAQADGTGRGYQLGFIPVTSNDSSTGVTKSSLATLNGTLLAGRYNELVITIAANGTLSQASGLPVVTAYDGSFNPTSYLNGISGIDPTVKQILGSTLSTSATGAWWIGPMLAAGGNITVQADALSGAGSLTANGGPLIQITNNSSRTLLVGSAVIPEDTGGRVLFTGGAGASQFGASKVHEVNADRRAQLLINNTYTGSSGNSSYGPAIFLTGDLYNLSGLIHITNAKGSLGQFASTYGQQVLVEVPEGSMSVFQPNDYWPVGSNPMSEWASFDNDWKPDTAIQYIANAVFGSGTLANNNQNLLYGDLQSTVLYGGCLPGSVSSSSNCAGGVANSFTGHSIGYFHGMDNTPSALPVVPILTLQKTATSYASANLTGSQASQQIVGGQVGIQAKYIDINATISSGQSTTRTLSIGTGLDSWLATHYCSSHTCTSLVDIPDSYLTTTGGTLIRAKYDFVNQRVVVDDVNASGGGFVYLKGGIISTNQLGNIKVNNGYGQVTINNQSHTQLQLGNIDTGAGSVGIVQITDTLKATNYGQYATTWYVDTQGQGLSVYDNRYGGTSLSSAYLVSTSSGNTAQYNPKSGIRYQWSESASLYRTVNYDGNNFSVSNWVYNNASSPWTTSSGSVVDGNGNTNVYQQNVTGSLGGYSNWNIHYHGCGSGLGSNCHWDFKATGYESDGELYGVWTYRFPTTANVTVTQSVKADNPFNISFVGNATGAITASTTGNLIVSGRLNNGGGTTTLSGTNLSTLSGSSVYAHDLVLNASGAIGSSGAAFNASLASGGTLTATAGSAGLNLDLGSGALINALKAGNGTGDVVVNAVGDLLAASTAAGRSADVLGRNITLNSSTGAVGSSGNALRVNAVEVALGGGGSQFGVVNSQANKAIYLEETTGNLWVGQIASETSDVWVKVDNGSLFDAGRRGSQSLADGTQQAIWQKLALTADYGAADNITASSVTPFQDQVNANYREYWSLLELGSVQNGQFQLSSTGLALYRPMVALKLGIALPTDAQVASYASGRYSTLTTDFSSDIGNDWRSQAAFQAYNAAFSYVASAAQKASLAQDAVWTEAELLYAINQNAIDGSASTAIGSSEPSISGRNVTLSVANDVGQLADSLNVTVSDLRNGTLTTAQAAALAVATAPGDVITNKDTDGKIVSLTVNRTLPFYVNATGQFDLDAGGSAYLQSQPSLQVGTVSVDGDSRLASAGSILAASGGGNFHIGGDLTLQANSGSVGTAGNTPAALNLDVGGALRSASAGQDIAINWLDGDFAVGQIIARGDVYLNASSGSLLQQGSDLAVSGRNVRLLARDAIGSATRALQVEQQSATAGVLSGSAGQGIWLTTEKALTIGSLSAGQGLSLTSTSTSGLLSADSLTALGGDLRLDSLGDITLRTAQASGQALLSSAGDVTLSERFKGGSLAYVNSQGSLTVGGAAQLEATTLQLQSASLAVGQEAHMSATDVDLDVSGASLFGKASRIDASGTLSLGHGTGASGNLTLGEQAVFSGSSLDLHTASLQVGNAAQLLASGALNASASSLNMGSNSLVQAGGTLSLTTTGDMTLGQLLSTATGGTLFDLDAGGHLLGNGDGATNLLADATGDAFVRAGQGIGTSTRALTVKLPKLTTISATQGDVFLTALRDLQGTTFEAEQGNLVVNAQGVELTYDRLAAHGSLSVHGGNLDVGHLQATTGTLSLDGLGQVSVDSADVGGLATVTAADVILGRFDSAGAFTAVTSGDFGSTTQSTGGAFSLQAVNATIGSLDVAGSTGMILTGDLDLGTLNGGGTWTLDAVNATVGSATLNRANANAAKSLVRMTLSQDLLGLGLLDANADWNLAARNADVTEARVQGNVSQTLSGHLDQDLLDGEGSWTLNANSATVGAADVAGQVTMSLAANAQGQGGSLNLTSLTGGAGWTLDAVNATVGSATLNRANAAKSLVRMTLSQDLLGLGLLDANADWNLAARNADVTEARVQGNVSQTLSGQLDQDLLDGEGSWTLNANSATVGTANVAGQVAMTLAANAQGQGGSLNLTSLTGGAGWTLDAVNATVGSATLNRANANAARSLVRMTLSQDLLGLGLLDANADWNLAARHADVTEARVQGNVTQTLSGKLTQASLDGEGRWTLDTVDADLGLADLQGNVQQTVTGTLTQHSLVTAGNWTLDGHVSTVDSADVDGTVVIDQSGLLTLGTLTGHRTLNLIGTDAVLGTATLGGTADLSLSGDLQLTDTLTALSTTLDLGSGSNLHALDVTGRLGLTVDGPLNLGTADVSGKAVLTHIGIAGTALHYGSLTVGDTLDVSGPGDWSGDSADVMQTATFDVGSADLGSLVSRRGRLSLKAASLFAADNLTSTLQDVDLNAGSADLGDVLAATTINVLTTGNLSIFTGDAGGNITLHTVNGGALGDIRFGAYYADDASGFDLNRAYLRSAADIDIFSDGNVYGGNAVADGEVRMIGRNLDFGRAQSLGTDVFLQATGPFASEEGNITGLVVDALRDVSIIANGNLSMPTVKYGGTYSLKAGRDLTVGIGGNLDVTGAAEAGRDLTFLIGGKVDLASIKAGRDVLVTSGEYINITDGVTAGGNITLKAADGSVTVGSGIVSTGLPYLDQVLHGNVLVEASGNVTTPIIKAAAGSIHVSGHDLTVNDLSAFGSTRLNGNGAIVVSGTSRSGTFQTWTASERIGFGQLLAGGEATLTAGGDVTGNRAEASRIGVSGQSLTFANLKAMTDTDLFARGFIDLTDTSDSGGDQDWHADESITFGRLLASGQALLDSLLDTHGSLLRADQGATVNAGWRNKVATGASIRLDQAIAPTLSLWAGNLIRVADAGIGRSADLHGQDIALYGRHTGSGQLNLWVTGSGKAAAQRFDTRLTADSIVAPQLHAVNSHIVTSGSRIDLQDAVYVDLLDLTTAQAHVVADNLSPAYQAAADVQLYELDKAFAFKQEALTGTTNAYVVHRKVTHQVLLPNFSEAHAAQVTGVMVQGVSAARYSEQQATGRAQNSTLHNLMQAAFVLPLPSAWTPASIGAVPMEQRFNLDLNNLPTREDGLQQWEL